MPQLAEEHCVRVTRSATRLSDLQRDELLEQLPDWRPVILDDIERLEREFRFADYARALEFTQRVGLLAEVEDHHPAILTQWGRVTVTWWTHVVGGLHRNDFVMASQTDRVYTIAMS
ncbi:MAG: 4a-hydroxytetrahydrobiopterin dehydratase [Proteobacteria bacterium]|nr:4a-hydroxytetrahydrobiopterin dehydratase [Pseudomonadota bacterium]